MENVIIAPFQINGIIMVLNFNSWITTRIPRNIMENVIIMIE